MQSPLLLEPSPTLATSRLTLRIPQPGDGPALFDAIAESLQSLRRFLASLPWVAADPSVEASEVFCRNAHANFHARKDFAYLVFEARTSRLVGVCGLHRPDWTTPKLEVGYWCRTSAAGNGYVTEAVQAVCDHAFERLGAVRLAIVTDRENTASRRVAERCGFELEGTLRSERRDPHGSLRDTCIYARLREEA